jgi:hypothetical protein
MQEEIVEIASTKDQENAVLSVEEMQQKFSDDLVKKYPKAGKKLHVEVAQYGINLQADHRPSGVTTFISPHGIEFKSTESYPEGALLKIQIAIPDFWERKKKVVEYGRVDTPTNLKLLARVVSTENVGKRGKKMMVLCRTVNIEEADEQVLKNYLQEG